MQKNKAASKTDILFIVPPFHFQRFNRYDDRQSGGHIIYYPHLGMMMLAACLDAAGFNPALVDAEADGLDASGIVRRVRDLAPAMVGITVTSPTLDSALKLIGELKSELGSETPQILLGGPHVTLDPGIVEFLGADFGLAGEAEQSIVEFCRWRLEGEEPSRPIPGLIAPGREGESSTVQIVRDLGALPHPMRSLSPGGHYFSALWGGKVTSVLGTRGCPFNCSFCDRSIMGRTFRARPPEHVLDEIDRVISEDFHFVAFVDEVFTYDRPWCEAVIQGMAERGVEFSVQTRVDLVDRELLAKLRRAGCRLISFGVETADEGLSRELNKNITRSAVFNAVSLAREAGLMINAFYMIGLPGDYLAQFRETLALARKLNTEFATINILSRLPGSDLGREQWERDKLTWREYARGEASLPILHDGPGDRERLVALCKEFYRRYYLRPALVWRHLARVRSVRDAGYLLRQARVFVTQYAT